MAKPNSGLGLKGIHWLGTYGGEPWLSQSDRAMAQLTNRCGYFRVVGNVPGATGGCGQMRFMVQLLLPLFAGLALGYVLLSLWDVMGPLDPFATRYGR